MALAVGTRLGPYEIVGALGAGGMGEVYRARDARLGRDVAIKVLPPHLSADPDSLARFEREMKTIGALSHPHIIAIYDVGQARGSGARDEIAYAVTELLEGETLAALIARGPVPVRKAIDYGVQIARGLAGAHERGIVHRDLKPENIFITTGGHVKVLDFGLARDAASAAWAGDAQTAVQTNPGIVLGTVGYMAPEQARGLATDHRADIFSFGCVLYEMVSGHRAFRKESIADTLSAILKDDPPALSGTHVGVPPALERVVHRCLEKNPGERFQSARDLAFALDALTTSGGAVTGATVAVATPKPWLRLALLAALVVATALAGWTLGRRSADAIPRQHTGMVRLTHDRGTIRNGRFAPDGQTIIFGAAWNGAPYKMFVTRADTGESNPLDLPAGDIAAISSAGDMLISLGRHYLSSWVAEGTLGRVPLFSSGPRQILEHVREADFLSENSYAIIRRVDGRDQLEVPQGKVVFETDGYLSHLRVSPDGTRIAFLEHPLYGDNRGHVAVFEGGKVKRLTSEFAGLEGLAWTHDGRELWFGGAQPPHWAIMAVRSDVTQPVGGRVVWYATSDLVPLDIDSRGRLLATGNHLVGPAAGLLRGDAAERDLRWRSWSLISALSRDGRMILFTNVDTPDPDYHVYVRQADSAPVHIGKGRAQGLSPDARWALSITPSAPRKLFLLPTGTGESRQLDTGTLTPGTALFVDGDRVLVTGTREAVPSGTVIDLKSGQRQDFDLSVLRGRVYVSYREMPVHVSPDGSMFSVTADDGAILGWRLTGGAPVELLKLEENERFVGWTADPDRVYVAAWDGPKARVDTLQLSTRRRTPLREIVTLDPAGMLHTPNLFLTPDASSYLYSFTRMESTLYLVSGLR